MLPLTKNSTGSRACLSTRLPNHNKTRTFTRFVVAAAGPLISSRIPYTAYIPVYRLFRFRLLFAYKLVSSSGRARVSVNTEHTTSAVPRDEPRGRRCPWIFDELYRILLSTTAATIFSSLTDGLIVIFSDGARGPKARKGDTRHGGFI